MRMQVSASHVDEHCRVTLPCEVIIGEEGSPKGPTPDKSKMEGALLAGRLMHQAGGRRSAQVPTRRPASSSSSSNYLRPSLPRSPQDTFKSVSTPATATELPSFTLFLPLPHLSLSPLAAQPGQVASSKQHATASLGHAIPGRHRHFHRAKDV